MPAAAAKQVATECRVHPCVKRSSQTPEPLRWSARYRCNGLATAQPVDQTVIVDAERAAISGQYDHSDPSADANLRAFFTSAG